MGEGQIRKLFGGWKHRLGLDLWHMEVRVEPPEGDQTVLFQVRRSSAYNRAVVSIPPWLVNGDKAPEGVLDITITDEIIEAGIVHELLHCVRHQTHILVMDQLDGQLHRDAYTMFSDSFHTAEELEIENLAVALVKAWHSK